MGFLKLYVYGLMMGVADVIPGVSGGTVAFILGIYERFIESIKKMNKGWPFLLPLILGIATSIACTASLVQYMLNHEVWRMMLYCFFFGLIISSSWFCSRQIPVWKKKHLGAFAIGAICAFLLTAFPVNEPIGPTYSVFVGDQEFTHVSYSTLTRMMSKGIIDQATPLFHNGYTIAAGDAVFVYPKESFTLDGWMILCGSVAVCAMLLPGISGCYMLALLGVYPVIIGAVADLVGGDLDAFELLANFAIGVGFGAIFFSRLVSFLLKHYKGGTIAAMTGFVVGALPAVWPFWSLESVLNPLAPHKGMKLNPIAPIMPDWSRIEVWAGLSLVIIGFTLVFVLERAVKTHRLKTAQ